METEHKVEGGLLLNIIVRESMVILKLLSSKDQALLAGSDSVLSVRWAMCQHDDR